MKDKPSTTAATERVVTLGVCPPDDVKRRFMGAFGGEDQGAQISFESPALMFKVLAGRRWDLLNLLTGAGPLTIREVARRAHRDVKAVHSDVQALLKAGILRKTAEGKIVFPFDAIHVDFMLKAA
jgi:predicted transcriptional regulator